MLYVKIDTKCYFSQSIVNQLILTNQFFSWRQWHHEKLQHMQQLRVELLDLIFSCWVTSNSSKFLILNCIDHSPDSHFRLLCQAQPPCQANLKLVTMVFLQLTAQQNIIFTKMSSQVQLNSAQLHPTVIKRPCLYLYIYICGFISFFQMRHTEIHLLYSCHECKINTKIIF